MIQTVRNQSHQDIIDHAERQRRRHRIVREHVSQNRHLARSLDITPQQLPEQGRERALVGPLVQRMKQQLVAPIGILLPSRELVKHRQGDTLFESIVAVIVARKTNNKPGDLEAQRLVEVLRDVRVGPEFRVAFLGERDGLDGLPAQEGVVPDEAGEVAAADGVLDGVVDEVREVGDCVLEVVVSDLHHAAGVLHDRHVGTLEHLQGSELETVDRLWFCVST